MKKQTTQDKDKLWITTAHDRFKGWTFCSNEDALDKLVYALFIAFRTVYKSYHLEKTVYKNMMRRYDKNEEIRGEISELFGIEHTVVYDRILTKYLKLITV